MPRASDPVRVAAPGDPGTAASGEPDGDVYTMIEAARLKGVSYHTVSRAVRRGTAMGQGGRGQAEVVACAKHPAVAASAVARNPCQTANQVIRLVYGRLFARHSPSLHLVQCRQ